MQRFLLICLFSFGLALNAFQAAVLQAEAPAGNAHQTAATLRTIAQGELTGLVADNGALVWRGIPYAQPPVGNLRWKPSLPPKPWTGRFVAVKDGNPCVQSRFLAAPFKDEDGDGFVGSEDCLYLNIFAPSEAASGKKFPIMYWIHGGGNVGGHNASPAYDGSVLAQKHQVVVVAINYRLGILGWFMHPAFAGQNSGPADQSGNWGTLDTIRGLEWVRDNIAAFGGDPANVTIFGESAGGINVFSLVLSPMARGLFHRAISQSGALQEMPLASTLNFSDDPAAGSPNSAREVVNKILVRDGKAKNRQEAKAGQLAMSAAEITALLYSQTPVQIYKLINPEGVRLYTAPFLFSDGAVLPAEPAMKAFAAGKFNRVPMIIGTNRDERRFYLMMEPRWRKILLTNPEDYLRYTAYGSQAWKQRHVDDVARAITGAGNREIYAYRFDWDEEGIVDGIDMSVVLGAGHTVEIPFVFGRKIGLVPFLGNFDDPARHKLSASMMSYWAQFAYAGNPAQGRSGGEVRWMPWNRAPGADKMIIFDTDQDGGIRMSPEELTQAGLKAALVGDRSFNDQSLQCELYTALFRGLAWSRDEYMKVGREGCAKYPVAEKR